ncbi:ornithine decarboxylase [Ceraceosorus guamensis]|uniref:ornithine decarboxylase n=1 Tax=Ceraceosorus guamensis TaxID=1522189 RepID=A0A316W3G9_9BASI|nr:ornithine decarboxylase [Ceraceosorus guamensis]PWN43323.1 ornithine decarboxylase [Ceraceosorus guamensis]
MTRPDTPPADYPSPLLRASDASASRPLIKSFGGSCGKPVFAGSVDEQLKDVLNRIDIDECEANGENAFFVADLAEVYRQHIRWQRALPRVIPFYAVKCNPDPYVLRLLAALGTGFDCASNGEIQNVLDLGVSPSRIIYANPCKAASFVRNARDQGISLTTFDNTDELVKMKRFHPQCKLVVRILTDDSKSVCQLGLKFGAPLDNVPRLLAKARELELDVVGVSFHVGSGCYDPLAFKDAVHRARQAFDMGAKAGYQFDLLDLGGGYAHDNFDRIASVLGPAIDEYFPDRDFAPGGRLVDRTRHGLRIIAEPGRYYVQKAFVLAANIIARRETAPPPSEAAEDVKPAVMYYQNDGMYGAFNCILFDHATVHPKVLTMQQRYAYEPAVDAPGVADLPHSASEEERQRWTLQPCSVWGPTCDSIDCVRSIAHLPKGLEVGDWLVYEEMGAYTICAASSFNGLRQSEVRYTVGWGPDADRVQQLLLDSAQSL